MTEEQRLQRNLNSTNWYANNPTAAHQYYLERKRKNRNNGYSAAYRARKKASNAK